MTAPAVEASGSTVPLRRNSDFRRLWIGGALSEVGSRAADLATPLLVLAVTGSPLLAGSIGAVRLGAFALAALPGGTLADRWDRRRVMLAAESLRTLAATALAATVVAGAVSVPVFIGVAIVDAVGMAAFGPAQTAALPRIVAPDQLGVASARNEARGFFAELAGPPIGGALFGLARWAPYAADAASYVASLIAVARIRTRLHIDARSTGDARPLRETIGAGLRFVRDEPFLRVLLTIGPLGNLAMNGIFFALIVTLRQRGLAAAGIGAVQTMVMIGGLAGAGVAGPVLRRVRPAVLIIGGSWFMAAMALVLGALPGTYLLAAPLFGLMLLGPAQNGAFFARQVAVTPDHLLGRVEGATGMLSQALSPAGPLLAGLLIEYAGQRAAFVALGSVLALAALIVTLSRAVRDDRPATAVE